MHQNTFKSNKMINHDFIVDNYAQTVHNYTLGFEYKKGGLDD